MRTGLKFTGLGVFVRAKQVMGDYVCIKHRTTYHKVAAFHSVLLAQSVPAAL